MIALPALAILFAVAAVLLGPDILTITNAFASRVEKRLVGDKDLEGLKLMLAALDKWYEDNSDRVISSWEMDRYNQCRGFVVAMLAERVYKESE